jgi:hypothetical protein
VIGTEPRNHFDRAVIDGLRDGLKNHPEGHPVAAACGLWCPICGADTDPDVPHGCSPSRPLDMRGLTGII